MLRPSIVIAIAVLLIPSALFLGAFPDLPRFGTQHDETLYVVSAKSLTDGQGYRIASLPGEPAQTKYPPLYPLLLSIAWRVNPEFPANLPLAAWISWLAIPAILVQLGWWLPRLGFRTSRTVLLMGIFALNPYVIVAGSQLLTELWFLALLLASLMAMERAMEGSRESDRWTLAAAAGVLAGLAYLTRTAGLMMLPAVFLVLWPRKQVRLATVFAAAMLPFVAGWMLWARLNQMPTGDPTLIYYLDYFRYQVLSVSFDNLHVLLWKNLDGLLWSLGGLIIPKVTGSLLLKILSQVIAVAMISGVVRLWRRGTARLYAAYALFSCLLLWIWHYPPVERFVLPLFPLALGGLLVELEHLASMLAVGRKHRDRSQRIAAVVMAGAVGLVLFAAAGLQLYVDAVYLPEDARQSRTRKADRVAAYLWLRENTPPDAAFLSSADPLVYLYTGRHAMGKTLPPPLWYRDDRDGMVDWLSELQPFAREHGLTHFDFAGVDLASGLEDADRVRVEKRIAESPALKLLFEQGGARSYAFSNAIPDSGPGNASAKR